MKLTLKEILFLIDYLSGLSLKTQESLKRVQLVQSLREVIIQLQKEAGEELKEYSLEEEFTCDIQKEEIVEFLLLEQAEMSGELAFIHAELVTKLVGEQYER